MNFISNLLAGWGDIFKMPEGYKAAVQSSSSTYTPWDYEWMNTVFGTVTTVLYIIMGLVGAAGAIYAIYLGIQLARADEQGKRDEAKKHLITVLIAVGATVALILFFNLLLPEIVKAFVGGNIYYTDTRVTWNNGVPLAKPKT